MQNFPTESLSGALRGLREPPVPLSSGMADERIRQQNQSPGGFPGREYHLTENSYIINSETIMDVNNYIPFSKINSQVTDVM